MRYLIFISILFSSASFSLAETITVWCVRNVSYTNVAHPNAVPLKVNDTLTTDMKIIIANDSYLLIGKHKPFSYLEVRLAGTYTLDDLWKKKCVLADSLSIYAENALAIINGNYTDPYKMNIPAPIERNGYNNMKLLYIGGGDTQIYVLADKTYTLHWIALSEGFKNPTANIRNLFDETVAEPVVGADQTIRFNFRQIAPAETSLIVSWRSEKKYDQDFQFRCSIEKKALVSPEWIEKNIILASGTSDFSLLIAAEYCKPRRYFIDAVDYYLHVQEEMLLEHLEK